MSEKHLLFEIMKYNFYAVELNLYLDNFPNNTEAVDNYRNISAKLDELIYKYEKQYEEINYEKDFKGCFIRIYCSNTYCIGG